MYLLHLFVWFIAYSFGIAGAAAVLFLYHRIPDREGRILSRLQISVLLFVFSASFISFSYELSISDLVYSSGIYIMAHLTFFLGIGCMSIFLTELSKELRGKNGLPDKAKLHTIFVGLIILLQSIGTLRDWQSQDESLALHVLYGALQILLFIMLSESSIRAGTALSARRFISEPGKKLLTDILIAVFVLLVFTSDILIGTYHKLTYGEELSVFILLPVYSCCISLAVVWRLIKKRNDTPEKAFGMAGLSPREQDVALLLITGTGYQQIADRLNVSLSTVQSHVKSIYRKTGTSNKTELNNYANS